VLRIPTNPPLFSSVTVPVHIPVLLSIVEEDTPPMTTSSKGANWKRFLVELVEDGDQIVSPGRTFLVPPFLEPPRKGIGGGLTNLELWLTNLRTSHGFRSLLLPLSARMAEVVGFDCIRKTVSSGEVNASAMEVILRR